MCYVCYANSNYCNTNYYIMKFYSRAWEFALLTAEEKRYHRVAQIVFVVGRSRIGKTSLFIKAYHKTTSLIFL